MPNPPDIVIALRQVSFCRQLSDGTLAALAQISMPISRPAGALIQSEGDPGEAMYVVVRGRVKIARVGANGREQIMYVVGPGAHFNTVVVFDHGPCPANAEALSAVDLLVIGRDRMRHAVQQHADLAMALLEELGARMRHLVGLVDDLALHSVQGRLARLLLQQAEAAEHGDVAPPLTQAAMAAQLGTVREMVSRTLRAFEGMGYIRIDRGMIVVLDRAALGVEADA
ncbi:MAG: Crp/Fnr family transcriptional regulator [Roseiflexaceae bacterium]